MDFEREFETLTTFRPLRWRSRLFRDYLSVGILPAAVDIPTGLGKTSVMAISYLALKAGASLPRRLVYVVDRRAVVDQATSVADDIKLRSKNETLRVSTQRVPARRQWRLARRYHSARDYCGNRGHGRFEIALLRLWRVAKDAPIPCRASWRGYGCCVG